MPQLADGTCRYTAVSNFLTLAETEKNLFFYVHRKLNTKLARVVKKNVRRNCKNKMC